MKFGTAMNKIVLTSSACINDSLVDQWSYTWTTDNNSQINDIKADYNIDDMTVEEIRKWVDNKHNENKLGWIDVFTDITTADEYRKSFFSHLDDLKLFSIYFDETEANAVTKEFKPKTDKEGEIGLVKMLIKRIEEGENNDNETLVGYDLIGIEYGGSYHTFHCHDIAKELSDKFGLTLNSFGLFDNCNNWKPVLDYLNDEENGCEPVPWFVVKTKLVINSKQA